MVVDASAVLEILSHSATGLQLAVALKGIKLHAPHLIDLEVANAVRRWERLGVIAPGEAAEIFETFLSLDITRHPHTPLLDEIWAFRHNLTAYDASYLALARALNAELLTMDSGLTTMATRH